MRPRTEIKVRGYHCDFYGHVNNARYLEFLEEDRWASLEHSIDLPKWKAKGLVFLVVNINVNYRKAVGVGQALQVQTTLDRIGSRSGVLQQTVVLQGTGEVAADAAVTFVIIDASGKAVPLEGEIADEIGHLKAMHQEVDTVS